MEGPVEKRAAQRAVFAREPSPLVRRWRQAIARAATPFWRRSQLSDLAAIDPALHTRLLAGIAAVDMACAKEDPAQLAAVGAALVAIWDEAVAVVRARYGDEGEPARQGGHQDWLIKLATLEPWPPPSSF